MARALLYGQSGGGINDTLPPPHANFLATGGDARVTLCFDAMPSEYAAIYKDTVICLKSTEPEKPGDYTKRIIARPDGTYVIEGGILLGEMPIGTLVYFGTYYNVPIVWKIADQNHAGYPANSTTLITDKIISLKCFDAMEPGNSDDKRKSGGNNRYLHSNIRQWLNSAAPAGEWYAAQHGVDTPPASANVWSSYNGYDQEAGFLNAFSARLRTALLETTLTVAKSISPDGGGSETVTDRIFLASTAEVGIGKENGIAEGVKLALFSDNTSRLAYPTAQCVSNSTFTDSGFRTSAAWYWWLRTPNSGYSCDVRRVDLSGALRAHYAYYGYEGIRPLCNLSAGTELSSKPDAAGVYSIVSL